MGALASVRGALPPAPAQQSLALTENDDDEHDDAGENQSLPPGEPGAAMSAHEGAAGESKSLAEPLGEQDLLARVVFHNPAAPEKLSGINQLPELAHARSAAERGRGIDAHPTFVAEIGFDP